MTNNESGRSMVEMLGVLAIIGVLSIGGIAGYTQAMKKYKTNEAVNTIAMAAVLCSTRTSTTQTVTLPTSTYVTLSCYDLKGVSWEIAQGAGISESDVKQLLGDTDKNFEVIS